MARTVPAPATEVPGYYQTAALFNAQVRDLNNFALGPPVFRGYQATLQSLATGVWVSISLDTEAVDSDGGHSTVTNPSRYVCQVAGLYLVGGAVAFAANGTGYRGARMLLNGSSSITAAAAFLPATSAGSQGMTVLGTVQLAVGDYVEIQGSQNSGGSINTVVASDLACGMTVLWISR
ncbi:hypothetical protein [Streptomyces goshikiensis]|uniref:hypothetical protein n=1 Tax=Streptomyces goshikiensis TaxID=1942 RepID=UPI0036A20CA1